MKLNFKRIEEPFVFELENEKGAKVLIDASEDIGGKNKSLTPMQLLAGSLAGCMSIDVILILNKQKINPQHFSIELLTERKVGQPSPFTGIHLKFKVSSDVPEEKLERAILLSKEKYCSVSLSLHPEITISHEIEYCSTF
ncbi:MAG TPA: disulfide bond formation regulator [Crocinitomicaceae bacterium]|nr:OsmC family peroxiredoxin [Flavobacteriales bacterium]HBW87097.1 disulfide bond formation regulator [Crocinitomicaceae bacterium]